MANARSLSLFFTLFLIVFITQGSTLAKLFPMESHFQVGKEGMVMSSRRLLIGSTAPNCTYNECRGCRYKCRAEQVPVEGNDPMHSPYRYKCVCHS